MSDKGCQTIYIKVLSPNDNSKNQIYLGGSFDILNVFPSNNIFTDVSGKRRRESFKSKLNFFWVNQEGNIFHAPTSQLILYPDYPEVRFSGFLKNCEDAPSDLLTSRAEGRMLFMAANDKREIFGFVSAAGSEIANEIFSYRSLERYGVFYTIAISGNKVELHSKSKLLKELKRINQNGWINSKRLTPKRQIIPCVHSNCGGFTLEAELGIATNSNAEPDFLGWEVKQFAVANFEKINSTVISLMDHSPTHGLFKEKGVEEFIKRYGYNDKLGREARMNFGGIYKYDQVHSTTALKLMIDGFNVEKKKIEKPNGFVALIDKEGEIAASWSFTSIIEHWIDKHTNACYVPSQKRINEKNESFEKIQYSYGHKIILGSHTDVNLFLYQLYLGNIYFDPGIKLEFSIAGQRSQKVKVRSLFRTKSGTLSSLYSINEVVNLNNI
ncbi:MAG: MvaI/BcnI family restriction endonuclease [Flavisolibacter sp.]